MRIAFIAAGAANMYCGSCLRDNAVAGGLMKLGHEVVFQPLYTPMRLERDDVTNDRVFYGGANVFLQQKLGFFRRFGWFDPLLDSPWLLRMVSKRAGLTQAADLGALTLSTVKGPQGHQKREVEKLARWLAEEVKPEIVSLPNAMFLGIASRLQEATGAPILCQFNSEDVFLEGLIEPYRSETFRILRERARDVDGFIAISHYYAGKMAELLNLDPKKIDVVPMGLDPRGFGREGPRPTDPFTVGYLARIDPAKGLHVLIETMAELRKKPGAEGARLRVAGYLGPEFKNYIAEVERQAAKLGMRDAFTYVGEVDFEGKLRFLDSLSVLCVPAVHPEPKGLYVLEALAHGVPVVEPPEGAFPELIEATGGGLLAKSNEPSALAEALYELAIDPERAEPLAEAGRRAVAERMNAEAQARATLAVYEKYV